MAQLPGTSDFSSLFPSLAAMEPGTPVAPGDAALGDAAQEVKGTLRRAVTSLTASQEERLEEVYSGALDGLSGADIAPAVEELQTLFGRLARALSRILYGPSDDPAQPPPAASAAAVSGWLSGIVERVHDSIGAGGISGEPAAAPASSEELSRQIGSAPFGLRGTLLELAESTGAGQSAERGYPSDFDREQQFYLSELGQHEAVFGCWATDASSGSGGGQPGGNMRQVAFDLSELAVPADIGFTAAANNAVTTAANVNSQLSGIITPLRATAADVRRIADEISAAAAAIGDGARAQALAESTEKLQAALGSASEIVSVANSGFPALIGQLEEAVAALKQAAPPEGVTAEKVSALARKLEAAAAVLREAAASVDVSASLQSAREDLPEAGATRAAQKAEPAVRSLEKAVGGLQSAVAELEAAVGATKGIDAPPAPPLKD